jgi:hypothetical protein
MNINTATRSMPAVYAGEVQHIAAREPGRDRAPEVMQVLCDNLETLQPSEVRTATQIGIDTASTRRHPRPAAGRLQQDKNGAAVLIYDNAKAPVRPSPGPRRKPTCSPPTNAVSSSTVESNTWKSVCLKHSASKPGANPSSAPPPTSTRSTRRSPTGNSGPSTYASNSKNATKTSPRLTPPTANSWPKSTPPHDNGSGAARRRAPAGSARRDEPAPCRSRLPAVASGRSAWPSAGPSADK